MMWMGSAPVFNQVLRGNNGSWGAGSPRGKTDREMRGVGVWVPDPVFWGRMREKRTWGDGFLPARGGGGGMLKLEAICLNH